MDNIILRVLKDILISIITGVVFGLMKYILGDPVDLKEIIIVSVTYFFAYLLISYIAPKLRKIFGFKK